MCSQKWKYFRRVWSISSCRTHLVGQLLWRIRLGINRFVNVRSLWRGSYTVNDFINKAVNISQHLSATMHGSQIRCKQCARLCSPTAYERTYIEISLKFSLGIHSFFFTSSQHYQTQPYKFWYVSSPRFWSTNCTNFTLVLRTIYSRKSSFSCRGDWR